MPVVQVAVLYAEVGVWVDTRRWRLRWEEPAVLAEFGPRRSVRPIRDWVDDASELVQFCELHGEELT